MIERAAETILLRLTKGVPVVCVTGPRQSGKTTLVHMTFPQKPYISLEDPDRKQLAKEDPRGLLDQFKEGLILEEVQAVPEIFACLKTVVDQNPILGSYIVTGSLQFNLLAGVTESLAGRAALVTLLPLSVRESTDARLLKPDPFESMDFSS